MKFMLLNKVDDLYKRVNDRWVVLTSRGKSVVYCIREWRNCDESGTAEFAYVSQVNKRQMINDNSQPTRHTGLIRVNNKSEGDFLIIPHKMMGNFP